MVYIGNSSAANFSSVTKDAFSGDGSETQFTLSKTATTNGVAVFVENVRQEPTTAYAVSGTTLTFTAAPVSSSGNNIYVLHHNSPVSTATHPATQALTATSGTFTNDVNIDGGSFVFNESSADKDFRVESNGNTHMLFVDGGNNGVGIGTSSVDTASTLTVSNTSDAHGITIVGALNKSRMQFQGANTGSGTTDGFIIGLSSSDDTNDDSALIGLKESGSMTFQTSGTNHMIIDGAGHVTKPLNSAFYCIGGANNNITKDGNREFLEGTGSEVYDVNGDVTLSDNIGFSPADVRYFTAPVTGKYMFTFRTRLDNIETASSYIYLYMRTGNRDYTIAMFDPDAFDSSPAYFAQQGTVIADMDANDTAYPKIYIAGGNSTTDADSYEFSGILIG